MLDRLFADAIASMQTATRRYAKRQTSWIRNQLLPEIRRAQAAGEDAHVFLLDATDPTQWDKRVRAPAEAILSGTPRAATDPAFLRGEPLPDPSTLSAVAAEQLAVALPSEGRIARNALVACDVCTRDPAQPFLVRESERAKHMQSRTHRYALRRRTRDAWIAERRAQGASVREARAAHADEAQDAD